MGANIETIFDMGEELEKTKKEVEQITKEENTSNKKPRRLGTR